MGGPMAGRLLDAGHAVIFHDESKEAGKALEAKGGRRVSSAEEMANQAEVVFLSLPNPTIVRQVALGERGLAGGSKLRIVVDLSTIGPGATREINAEMAKKNIVWADSPVSGGIAGAVNGTLAVMTSCPADSYSKVLPLLKLFGRQFYCGDVSGTAQVAKLGNNMIAAAVILLSAEAVAMGAKAGLDPAIMCQIINASSGRNSATEDKFPKAVLPRTFDFGFSTGLSYKHVKLCIDEAEALGVPMIAGSLVRQMLAVTNAKYGPDSDFTSMVRIVEDYAGVEIRSPLPS
jgi:3-hydroxyisobutyrate dehydrogenase-like beta-hydroxyacid dehydrogenase